MSNKNLISNQQKEIIINLFLNRRSKRLSIAQLHYIANQSFVELGLKTISYSTVRRVINYPSVSKVITKEYIESHYAPMNPKKKEDANKKIWLIDDMKLDMMCFDKNKELMRPYLSIIMENASKKIINYQLGKGINKQGRLELLTIAFKKSVSYPDIIRFDQSKINRNRKLLEGINEKLKVAPDCKIQYGFHTSRGAQTERFFYHFNTQFLNNSLILSTDQKTYRDTIGLSLSDLNEIVGHHVQNFNQSVENNAKQL